MAIRANWYIIQAYSGFEKKVAQNIKDRAIQEGLDTYVEDVIVPTEEVVEVKRGQKVTSERKFFPGYVLAKMVMVDPVYHLVTSTPKVSGFLGSGGKPAPITEKEVARILHQVEEGVERPASTVTYEIGEEIEVIDGPFTSFTGVVEDVDHERTRLKASVSIFGRATPVELEYTQVKKTS